MCIIRSLLQYLFVAVHEQEHGNEREDEILLFSVSVNCVQTLRAMLASLL